MSTQAHNTSRSSVGGGNVSTRSSSSTQLSTMSRTQHAPEKLLPLQTSIRRGFIEPTKSQGHQASQIGACSARQTNQVTANRANKTYFGHTTQGLNQELTHVQIEKKKKKKNRPSAAQRRASRARMAKFNARKNAEIAAVRHAAHYEVSHTDERRLSRWLSVMPRGLV
jgi:hypothetical protein